MPATASPSATMPGLVFALVPLLLWKATGAAGAWSCGIPRKVDGSEFEVPSPTNNQNRRYKHSVQQVNEGAGWIQVDLCNASFLSNNTHGVSFGYAVLYQQQPEDNGTTPLSINLAPAGTVPQDATLLSSSNPYRGGLNVTWPAVPITAEQAALCGEVQGGSPPNTSRLTYRFECHMLKPQAITNVNSAAANKCDFTVTWTGPYGCAQPALSWGWVFLSLSLTIYPLYLLIGSCIVYCQNSYLAYPMRGWWTSVCNNARRGLAVLRLAKDPDKRG